MIICRNCKSLDEELNQTFASKEEQDLHRAPSRLDLFARDYNSSQVPLMENEKEPGPKYLGEVIDLARRNNITIIFVEPEYNPKGSRSDCSGDEREHCDPGSPG